MVVLGGTKPDLRLFADSSLQIRQGILVDHFFRANIENVYALSGACEIKNEGAADTTDDDNVLDFGEQGRIAGLNISGQATPYARMLWTASFNIFNLSAHLIGETKTKEGFREHSKTDASANTYQKIFIQGNRLAGAVLLNCTAEREKIIQLIEEKQDASAFTDQILSPGWDREQPIKLEDAATS